MNELSIFNITENGFRIDGSGKVTIPACRIKATSYMDAVNKMDEFLATRKLTDDIELITPIEKIAFE